MTPKSIAILLATLLLTSCVKTTMKKPPVNAASDDASIKLAEAAGSVSRSLIELARIEKAMKPVNKKNLVSVTNYNLQVRASVDWSGPIEELTKRLAKASYYRVRVLGKKPPIPVLVSLTVHDETVASILRNIDYQAGRKADLRIYPKTKTIELRYAKA